MQTNTSLIRQYRRARVANPFNNPGVRRNNHPTKKGPGRKPTGHERTLQSRLARRIRRRAKGLLL